MKTQGNYYPVPLPFCPLLSPFWYFLVLPGAPSTFSSPRRFCFSGSSKRRTAPPPQRHETTVGTAGEHITAGGTSALRDHSNNKPESHTHISRRRDRSSSRASGVQTTVSSRSTNQQNEEYPGEQRRRQPALTPCLVRGTARSSSSVDSTRASGPRPTVRTLVGSPIIPMFPHTRPVDVKMCSVAISLALSP